MRRTNCPLGIRLVSLQNIIKINSFFVCSFWWCFLNQTWKCYMLKWLHACICVQLSKIHKQYGKNLKACFENTSADAFVLFPCLHFFNFTLRLTFVVFLSAVPPLCLKGLFFFCWRRWMGIMCGPRVQSFCFSLFAVFLYLMCKWRKVEQMKGKYSAQVNSSSSVCAGAQQKATGLKWGPSITE